MLADEQRDLPEGALVQIGWEVENGYHIMRKKPLMFPVSRSQLKFCTRTLGDELRPGCYFCRALLPTFFFCFASIASNASDKCGGIDLSPRSHRDTVIMLTPSALARCA